MKKPNRVKIKEVPSELSNAQSRTELMIDMTLEDSFPASDPPSWTLGREQNRNRDLNQKLSNLNVT